MSPTPASANELHPDLLGLDAQLLENLSHDYSSDFEDLANKLDDKGVDAGTVADKGDLFHNPKDPFVMDDSPIDEPLPPTEFERLIHSGDFNQVMEAGDFQELPVLIGPGISAIPSLAQPTPADTPELATNSTILNSHGNKNENKCVNNFPCDNPPSPSMLPATSTPSTPSHRGRLSATAIKSMADDHTQIDKIFHCLSLKINQSIPALRTRYMANMQDSHKSGPWNLYKQFLARFHEEEVARSGIIDGTFCQYFDNFMEEHNMSVENLMHAALNLDRLLLTKETLVKCAQDYAKHHQKLKVIVKDGMYNHFQTIAMSCGECMHKDAGLWLLTASPGLEKVLLPSNMTINFAEDGLRLNNNTLVGLAKVTVYDNPSNTLASKITKKVAANLGKHGTEDSVDGASSGLEEMLGDKTDLVPGCKVALVALLNACAKAINNHIKLERTPWGKLLATLLKLLCRFSEWPASLQFPTKKFKDKSGTLQGIRSLGATHGHTLFLALQLKQIKVVPLNAVDIQNDVVPIITTAKPTSDDPVGTVVCHLYYSRKVVCLGQEAPPSLAATKVKRKMAKVISVDSNSEPEASAPAPVDQKHTTHSSAKPKPKPKSKSKLNNKCPTKSPKSPIEVLLDSDMYNDNKVVELPKKVQKQANVQETKAKVDDKDDEYQGVGEEESQAQPPPPPKSMKANKASSSACVQGKAKVGGVKVAKPSAAPPTPVPPAPTAPAPAPASDATAPPAKPSRNLPHVSKTGQLICQLTVMSLA
ncbi:hypothetical protein DXG01_004139 [Tephrocybe rancida]|nr:hypothetical protein DXG01_004139 [Tephrocybe rancida]